MFFMLKLHLRYRKRKIYKQQQKNNNKATTNQTKHPSLFETIMKSENTDHFLF